MRKYPYIKLYLSVSNIYIALSIKHTISRTRLNLSLFQNLLFYSLMNVLFSSYHVTAIPSLNHSLSDASILFYTITLGGRRGTTDGLMLGLSNITQRFAELK